MNFHFFSKVVFCCLTIFQLDVTHWVLIVFTYLRWIRMRLWNVSKALYSDFKYLSWIKSYIEKTVEKKVKSAPCPVKLTTYTGDRRSARRTHVIGKDSPCLYKRKSIISDHSKKKKCAFPCLKEFISVEFQTRIEIILLCIELCVRSYFVSNM